MLHDLRLYQGEGVRYIRIGFRTYQAILYTLPTGGGKTHVFTFIATKAADRGNSTLIIVHRSYLWQQVSEKLTELGVSHGIIAPGHTATSDKIQIASIDTLIRRLPQIRPPDLIIYDEAHHVIKSNKWGKVANYFSNSKILGVTATPCRTSGQGLGVEAGGFFETLISGPSITELMPEFLTPFKVFAPEIGIDLTGIRRIAGDYDKKEVIKRIDRKNIYGHVPEHYKRICPGVPAIAFCVSVNHCHHVADEFKQNGISAEPVSGKTPENQRRYLFDGLASGKFNVLCACDLVSEGFDVPACGAGILLRPTQSLVLFMQQCGRTTRRAPGKDFSYILDHVGNIQRHGMPDQVRSWDLSGVVYKKGKHEEEGNVLTRTCPICSNVHSPAPTCPECGYRYLTEFKPPKTVEVELQEMKTAKEKEEVEKKVKKRRWHYENSLCKTFLDWKTLGEDRGYDPGWALKMHTLHLKRDQANDAEWAGRIENCLPVGG